MKHGNTFRKAAAIAALWAAAGASVLTGATPPEQPMPYIASEADFASKIKDLGAQTELATLQLGPGTGDTVHVLVEYREKKSGNVSCILYWARTVQGALGDVARVKAGKAKMDLDGRIMELNRFDIPPLTVRENDLNIVHTLTVLHLYMPKTASKGFVLDSVAAQRGMQRSLVNTVSAISIGKTGARLSQLWGKPILRSNLKTMSNPPEFDARLSLGGQAFVLPGQGTAGPLEVAVTELAAMPVVTERGSMKPRKTPGADVNSGFLPSFVMRKAKPSTEYQVNFSCQLGPALGVASNTIKIKSAEVINKAK